MATLSNKDWAGITDADYADAGDYCEAWLVNDNTGDPATWSKSNCHLPVREPKSQGGRLNRSGLFAAQGALLGARGGVTSITDAAKTAAARKLVDLMRQANLVPAEGLRKLAGDTSGGMNQAIRSRAGYG